LISKLVFGYCFTGLAGEVETVWLTNLGSTSLYTDIPEAAKVEARASFFLSAQF